MTKTFPALYENGVFRPLTPIDLEDQSRVTVTVRIVGSEPDPLEVVDDLIDWGEIPNKPKNGSAPSLEEVRRILSKLPGSMAELIIAEREDDL